MSLVYCFVLSGVNPEHGLSTDPLIVHYRSEAMRSQNENELLNERIRDLEGILAEYELYEDPCEGVQKMRQKLKMSRDQFFEEKRK